MMIDMILKHAAMPCENLFSIAAAYLLITGIIFDIESFCAAGSVMFLIVLVSLYRNRSN